MQITLKLIRNMVYSSSPIRRVFDHIKTVTPSIHVRTASMDQYGNMRYNPEFTKKHFRTNEHVFCLVMHECLHKMFAHFIYKMDDLTNVAADALINSIITHVFSKESDNGILFRELYEQEPILGVLRPRNTVILKTKFAKLYRMLYPPDSSVRISTGEVIRILKSLVIHFQPPPPHGDGQGLGGGGDQQGNPNENSDQQEESKKKDSESDEEEVSKDDLLGDHSEENTQKPPEGLAQDIKDAAKECGKNAGAGGALGDLLVEVINSTQTLKEDLLKKFAVEEKLKHFWDDKKSLNPTQSVLPLCLRRRDNVLLGLDVDLILFRTSLEKKIPQKTNTYVLYLDVSGSVETYLPKIISALMFNNLRNTMMNVFLFSTEIVEIRIDDLFHGKVKTTGGTDFDIVFKHMRDKRFNKAIMFTDGYASISQENIEWMRDSRNKIKLLSILFGSSRRHELEKVTDDILDLEDCLQSR